MNALNAPTHSARLRRWGGVTAAVVLTLGLGACGSEDEQETAGDTSAESSTAPSPTEGNGDTGNTGETGDTGDAAGTLPEWAPAIVGDSDGGVTGLDFSDVPEPGPELQSVLVTTGEGPEVQQGQTITADYYGSVYQGAEPFDESFSSQPFQAPIGVGQLIPGWDQTLVGVPVGSRVLMSIPSDLAYGEQDQPGIPGGSTLFFVVDVIDAA